MSLTLTTEERAQYAKRYKHDPVRTADYAERTAREWVQQHAGRYLPTIQVGVFRLVVAFHMQPDGAERRHIQVGIDVLLGLGKVIDEHRT